MRIINLLGYGIVCIRSATLYLLSSIKKNRYPLILRIRRGAMFNLIYQENSSQDILSTLRWDIFISQGEIDIRFEYNYLFCESSICNIFGDCIDKVIFIYPNEPTDCHRVIESPPLHKGYRLNGYERFFRNCKGINISTWTPFW